MKNKYELLRELRRKLSLIQADRDTEYDLPEKLKHQLWGKAKQVDELVNRLLAMLKLVLIIFLSSTSSRTTMNTAAFFIFNCWSSTRTAIITLSSSPTLWSIIESIGKILGTRGRFHFLSLAPMLF